MANRIQMGERRDKVKQLLLEGSHTKEIAKVLNVSTRTIEQDRHVLRDEIIGELANKALDKVLMEFLLRYDGIYRDARMMYRSTTNDLVKLGALNLMQKHEEAKIKILQSLGVLQVEPDKLELSGELTVARARELLREFREKKE